MQQQQQQPDCGRTDDDDSKEGDPSVAVLQSLGGGSTLLFVEHDPLKYGPVVDHLPSDQRTIITTTTQSMAVNVAELEKDFVQDDAMDETFVPGGEDDDTLLTERNTVNNDNVVNWDEDPDDEGDDDDDDDLKGLEDADPQSSIDQPLLESSLPRLEPYTFTSTEQDYVGDHTPSELGDTPSHRRRRYLENTSVVVLAAPEDLSRDTGGGSNDGGDDDVFGEENELTYCPVVDQTPQLPEEDAVGGSALGGGGGGSMLSATLLVVVDDNNDNVSGLFGDSTIAGMTTLDNFDDKKTIGDNDGNTINNIFDVDQSLELLHKDDSEAVQEHGSDVENDEDRYDDEKPASQPNMVDHLPFEMRESWARGAVAMDPSVAVLASINENDSALVDFNEQEETVLYGPMVDHTPTTPAHPQHPRSDSVIAQLNDEDETLDAADTYIEDGDTVDDELPSALLQQRADHHHHPTAAGGSSDSSYLVDRVPPRPESRFGDASTLVAADPSDVLSGVDDLLTLEGGDEAGDFGPVVDQTPPAEAGRPNAVPSGAGSTVVFAPPSVGGDDLDPDETGHGEEEDDEDEDGRGHGGWDPHHHDSEHAAAPNPQSDDEPLHPPAAPDQEQIVVDFLPEEAQVDNEANGRAQAPSTEASSEYAVGGAQSLLPAEDFKEDDFGPVVDQLPAVSTGASVSSTVFTLVTASEMARLDKQDDAMTHSSSIVAEEEKVVVDHVPGDLRHVDSIATVGQSQFTEEEDDDDDEETDSKFGPVVDHLPTPRALASASRGGSTVDALGTVSEGSDAGETDAWVEDDDLLLDDAASDRTDRVSQQGLLLKGLFRRSSTDGDAAASARANVSVRFDSSVRGSIEEHDSSLNNHDQPPSTPSNNDSLLYMDASMTSESTKYFDARPGASSFADAETPPSTPHHRPIMTRRLSRDDVGNNPAPWLDFSASSLIASETKSKNKRNDSCGPCSDSSNGDCPCVRKLLNVDEQLSGSLFGTLRAADGASLQVNFGQLLQDEMVKRRLVEEECAALRKLADKQHQHAAELAEARMLLEEMQEERDDALRQLAAKEDSSAALMEKIQQERDNAVASLLNAAEQQGWQQTQLSHQVARIQELEAALGTSQQTYFHKAKVDVAAANQSEVLLVRESPLEESHLAELQNANADLVESRGQVSALQKELATVRKELELVQCYREELKMSIGSANTSHSSELKDAKMDLEASQNQVSTLDHQLASVKEELELVQRNQQELERALGAAKISHSAELQDAKTDLVASQDQVCALKNQLASVKEELGLVQSNRESADSELIAKLRSEQEAASQECRELERQVERLKDEMSQQTLATQTERGEFSESVKAKLGLGRKKLEASQEAGARVARLQSDLEAGSAHNLGQLRSEKEASVEKYRALEIQIENLSQESKTREDAMEARCREAEEKCRILEAKIEETDAGWRTRVEAVRHELKLHHSANLAAKAAEYNQLQAALAAAQDKLKVAQSEKSQESSAHAEELENLREQLKVAENQNAELDCKITSLELEKEEFEEQLANKETELGEQRAELASRAAEYNQLQSVLAATQHDLNVAQSAVSQELSAHAEESEAVRKKLKAAEKQNADLDCKVTSLEFEKEEIEEQLTNKETELEERQVEFASKAAECNQLQALLAAAQHTLKVSQSTMSHESHAHVEELEALREKLKATEKQNADLDCKVTSLEFEKEEIEEQLANKETELGEQRAEFASKAAECNQLQALLAAAQHTLKVSQSTMSHELSAHAEEVETLREKLQATEKQIADLDCKVTSLEFEKDEVEEQLTNKETELEERWAELASKAAECNQLQALLAAAQHNVKVTQSTMSHESSAHAEELETLRAKLNTTEQRIAELDCKVTSLEFEKEEVEEQLTNKETELEERWADLEKAETRSLQLNDDLANLRSSLTKEAKAHQLERAHLQQQVAGLQIALDTTTAELKTFQDNYISKFQEMKVILAERDGLRQQLSQSEQAAAARQRIMFQETEKITVERDSLQDQLAKYKESIASFEHAVAAERSTLQEQLNQSEISLDSLQQSMAQLTRDHATLATERDAMREQLSKREDAALAAQHHTDNKLGSLMAECNTLRDKLSQSEEAAASLKRHIDEHGTEREVLDSKRANEINAMSADTKNYALALAAKEAQISSLTASLSRLEEENAALSREFSEMQSLRDEIDSLRKQLGTAESNLSTVHNEYQGVKNERFRQGVVAANLESELKAARHRLHLLESESSDWSSALERLQADKASMEASLTNSLSDSNALLEKYCREGGEHMVRLQQECDSLREQLHHDAATMRAELKETYWALEQTTAERDVLAEENEELLVQLGLMKEDMDMSEETLDRNLETLLAVANEVLCDRDWDGTDSDPIGRTVAALQHLGSRVEELQSRLDSETSRLVVIGSLERKCGVLDEKCLSQQAELDQLRQSARYSENTITELRSCLRRLEEESTQEKEVLVAKEAQIASTEKRLSQVVSEQQYGDNTFVCRIRELEERLSDAQRRASDSENSWKVYLEKIKQEHAMALAAGQDRVALLENRCQSLEEELRQSLLNSDMTATMQAQLEQLESESKQLRQLVAAKDAAIASAETRLQSEEKELNARIQELEAESESAQQRAMEAQNSLKELQERAQVEHQQGMQNLNQRLRELEAENRESQMRALETQRLQDKIKQEREQERQHIQTLQTRLESTRRSLEETRSTLHSKEEEIQALAAEIQNRDATVPLSDNVNDVSALRSHIISLAQALERSETQRADAMDQLTLERQVHADSLRKLGESVKRYFSSVHSSGSSVV